MRRPRDQENIVQLGAVDDATASVPGAPSLEEALQRCADGDAGGLDVLEQWGGERMRGSLLRLLGDAQLAEQVLATAREDIFRNAAMIAAIGRGPLEDRIFGLLRRHAYAALRAVPGQPPAASAPAAPPPPAARLVPPPITAAPPPSTVEAKPAVEAPVPASASASASAEPPAGDERPRAMEVLAQEELSRPGFRPQGIVTPLPGEPEQHEPRLRRPSPPRRPVEDEDTGWAEDEASQRRGWLRVVLTWLLAATSGFALAYLAILLLAPGSEQPPLLPRPEPVPSSPTASLPPQLEAAPPVATSPPITTPSPVTAPPPVTTPPLAPLGTPLLAPEPPAIDPTLPRAATPAPASSPPVAVRQPEPRSPPVVARPAQTIEPTLQPLPAQARIFIHHTANDGLATGLARSFAEQLRLHGARTVVVRQVPFAIRGLSVRYFHDSDRAAAGQTLDIAESMLGLPEQALADFTSFAPAPVPGTIEIWLPGGS